MKRKHDCEKSTGLYLLFMDLRTVKDIMNMCWTSRRWNMLSNLKGLQWLLYCEPLNWDEKQQNNHEELNKLVLTQSILSICLSTVLYPSTSDCYRLYHALLNASLCLILVNLSNSLFSLKSACFKYVPILDPILPRSTHDCFAWIDNFNPVLLQNNLFYFAHFIWSIYTVKSLTQYFTILASSTY